MAIDGGKRPMFYVKAYSFRNNKFASFIATCDRPGEARSGAARRVEEFLGAPDTDWKTEGCRYICDVDKDIFMEVA
jgi:hypothetical protein